MMDRVEAPASSEMLARAQEISRRSVCEQPPCPIEVMRELQQLARTHPEAARVLDRASDLIARQNATIIDVYRCLLGSRLLENLT